MAAKLALTAAALLLTSAVDAQAGVWFSAGTGRESVDLRTLDVADDVSSATLVNTDADGRVHTLAGGFRLWSLSLGLRGSWASVADDAAGADAFRLWSLAAEAELRMPIWRLEPFMLVGAGYRSVGDLGNTGRDIDIDGGDLRWGAGLDARLTSRLSVGIRVVGAFLMLSRDGMPVGQLGQRVDTVGEAKQRVMEAHGTTFGTSVAWTGAATLHF